MGRCFVSLVPAQDRHRNIAILNKAAAVQSAVEPVTQADRLLRPFGVGPVALQFTEQAKGFSHLGFGFIARPRDVG